MLDDPYITETPMPWMAEGAPAVPCVDTDADAWFPAIGGSVSTETRMARVICTGCPLRVECLEWSLAEHVDHGIFGGVGPTERRRLQKLRRAA